MTTQTDLQQTPPLATGQAGDRDPFTDPVRLARAARLVRASLARQGLTLADLVAPEDARTSSDTSRRGAA